MKLTLTIPKAETDKILPPEKVLADAASRGMFNLTRDHLRDRNAKTAATHMPKSGYYADAAESVTRSADKSVATVTIEKEGIALHYYGGTVLPKKKALAIPKSPIVAGIWPSELGDKLDLVWPKGEKSGTLRDKASGEILYLLVPRVTIKADKSVLPSETAYISAAHEAIMEAIAI